MSEKNYWNSFYNNNNQDLVPSPFAEWCFSLYKEKLKRGRLLDVGCGSGRDTYFFSKNGVDSTGIDIALPKIMPKSDNCHYIQGDLIKILTSVDNVFGIYSRFSIHSIKEETASQFYKQSYDILNSGGLLMIEVRSINDPLFGKGVPVKGEKNAFICGEGGGSAPHYRRFIDKSELKNELEGIGFNILYCNENNGWAKYKTDDPFVVRIVAAKRFQ